MTRAKPHRDGRPSSRTCLGLHFARSGQCDVTHLRRAAGARVGCHRISGRPARQHLAGERSQVASAGAAGRAAPVRRTATASTETPMVSGAHAAHTAPTAVGASGRASPTDRRTTNSSQRAATRAHRDRRATERAVRPSPRGSKVSVRSCCSSQRNANALLDLGPLSGDRSVRSRCIAECSAGKEQQHGMVSACVRP
jgi:hypothetical protein